MKLRPDKCSALIKERGELLQELSTFSSLISGSYFERYSTCSRPTCSCHQGKRHGPRAYLSLTVGKKQRQIYLSKDQATRVRAGIEQYRRLREIVERISLINLQLMREGGINESEE